MGRLTREEILGAATEAKRAEVKVKAWGGPLYVQEWTAAQYDAWEHAIIANRENQRAITVVHGLVDENGKRVFEDADAEALGSKPGLAATINRIATRIRVLNRLGAEDVEEEKGNSEPDRSESSASK